LFYDPPTETQNELDIQLTMIFLCIIAAQEGHQGLVQTAPENPKKERRRIWWQSQKEGQFSNQYYLLIIIIKVMFYILYIFL